MVECPALVETFFRGKPAAIARVICVWRSPWNEIFRSLCRFKNNGNHRVIWVGYIKVPSVWTNKWSAYTSLAMQWARHSSNSFIIDAGSARTRLPVFVLGPLQTETLVMNWRDRGIYTSSKKQSHFVFSGDSTSSVLYFQQRAHFYDFAWINLSKSGMILMKLRYYIRSYLFREQSSG